MAKYLVAIAVLGILAIILSVASVFETIHSRHRAQQAFKNISQQYDLLNVLRSKGGAELSLSNQADLLERFNREIEISMVFLNANNNRLQVYSLVLLLGISILFALLLKLYLMSKCKIVT